MNDPYCAICRDEIDPANDHTRVDVNHFHTDERNKVDDYYMHEQCAYSLFEGWGKP